MTRFNDVADDLRAAYTYGVETRDRSEKSGWKLTERAAFLDRLHAAGARSLIEIGAGTGQDSRYFQDNGLDVLATDLTPAMVEACAAKGLTAQVMNLLNPGLPAASFDAAYAMNCLLHVPDADLPTALQSIRGLLRPGGLFYAGVYGGDGSEGVAEWDTHEPKRFFSWRTDAGIRDIASRYFDVVDFHVLGERDRYRFQSFTLRRPMIVNDFGRHHAPNR